MNRKLKFRAWNGTRMITPAAIGEFGEWYETGRAYEDGGGNKEGLMQYTGLKDKNGKEIYEGDVFHLGDPTIKYIVDWFDTGLVGRQISNESRVGLTYWNDRIEVIGNIYETPIKGKDMKTLPEKTAEQLTPMQIAVYAVNCPNTDECINEIAGLIEKDRKEIERLKEVARQDYRIVIEDEVDWYKDRIKELESEIERLKDCELRACEVRDNRIKELEEALREWQARTSRQNYLFDLKCNTEVLLKQKALTKESAPSKEIEELKKEKNK